VTAGQIAAWTPIGAELTATGYQVDWKNGSADQYAGWNTDSSGNYLNNAIPAGTGSNTALESLEASFHQDLNGDGTIGVPVTTIEALGSTSLVTVCKNFYLYTGG